MSDTERREQERITGPTPWPDGGEPAPFDLHLQAAETAVRYSRQLAEGGWFRFPWPDIDRLTGPLMPGWLVLIGGRAKAGKSTLLRILFNSLVELGVRTVCVGTEQEAGVLKMLWACIRLQFPAYVAFDVADPRHALVLRDVTESQGEIADTGIITADPGLTLARFVQYARYAYRVKAKVLILDHFHRLGIESGEAQSAAVTQIKKIAAASGMLVVMAAQLKQGEGGALLGEYEVPGPSSWAGTSNLHRECDVSLQVWRPFKLGIERGAKQAARENPEALSEIVQRQTMAVRCCAHRYRSLEAEGKARRAVRLFVQEDQLLSWGDRDREICP